MLISLNSHFKQTVQIYKSSDIQLNNPNFDYICQIVSNTRRYYLEIRKIGSKAIECYHGQYDPSTEIRTTLYGIMQVIQHVIQYDQKKINLLLELQHPNAGHQLHSYQLNNKCDENVDLIEELFKSRNITIYYKFKQKFEQEFENQLNSSLSSHFSNDSVVALNENASNLNDKVSSEIITLDSFKYAYLQNNNQTFDYICRIFSNQISNYFEIQKTGSETVECYHGQYDPTTETRNTLFGIIRILKYINNKCCILLQTNNHNAGQQMNKFQKNILNQSNKQIANYDLLQQIFQYHGIQMYYKQTHQFENEFVIKLNAILTNKHEDKPVIQEIDCEVNSKLDNQSIKSSVYTQLNESINQQELSTSVKQNVKPLDSSISGSNNQNYQSVLSSVNKSSLQKPNNQSNILVPNKSPIQELNPNSNSIKCSENSVLSNQSFNSTQSLSNKSSQHSSKEFITNLAEQLDLSNLSNGLTKKVQEIAQSSIQENNSNVNCQQASNQQDIISIVSSSHSQSIKSIHSTSLSNKSSQEPQNITEHSNLKINQNNSHFLSGSNSLENEIEPQVTKIFEFQNLSAEQQKTVRKVLMEMDVSFQLLKSAQNQ
ncbi:Ribonuclease_H superfamily [Hexamita inflata]|uniref:Ribonuclease H superfamily n=1 Tax=Hexamita inflata TaxID=28002 RepID=A0AA86QQD1_9EUKA|nr:Ribonuclease H superfamily [Hexamita inflata]